MLRIIESMLQEDERERDLEEYPNYGNGVLAQYIEFFGGQLSERTKSFLENIRVLNRHHLKTLREKEKLELYAGPYLRYEWPALLPRLLFKLIHMFGYPSLRVSVGNVNTFSYLFLYKGHIIEVYDHKGNILFQHHTLYSLEEEDNTITPKEGAEEILKEFAENLLRIIMDVTPLHYGGARIFL